MRKRLGLVCLCLWLASSLVAQVRTGNIYGKVIDAAGAALPGVTVTVTGSLTAPVSAVTSAEGAFRFIGLAPAKDYALRAELQGFKITAQGDILISAGGNVDITLTLEQGSLEEEVTVTASNPVIDAKKSSVGALISQEMLQQLPSSRDAFNVMKMAPSVVAVREDVGGSESGQSVAVNARGAASGGNGENSIIMDGLPINWSQSSNATPFYWDFDTFEELNVTVGGADVTAQTGGVQTNMVTRRGGNTISFNGRFYFTDSKFQMDNMTDAFKKEGLAGVSRVNVIRDYGMNIGGPIIKNKIWFLGSYGVQDIQTITIYNLPSNSTLETLLGKLNLQIIPENRLEFFAQGNKKLMWGTATSTSNPEGTRRLSLYPFGYPLLRVQDEHMFGENVYASVKFGWYNSGYIQEMARDEAHVLLAINDLKDKRGYGGGQNWHSDDGVYSAAGSLTFFKDLLFGASHEFKVGFEWGSRGAIAQQTFPGNLNLDRNFIDPIADFSGDGFPDVPNNPNFYGLRLSRGNYNTGDATYKYSWTDAMAGFIADNIAFGRFNMAVGLRYDYQAPRTKPYFVTAIDRSNPATASTLTTRAIDLLDGVMPGVEVPGIKGTDIDGNRYSWKVLSPRINIAYDVTGDGKTMVKLSLSTFGNFMSTNEADRYKPGGSNSWMYFYWNDNGDKKADFNELFWYTVLDKKYSLYRVFDDAGNFVGNWSDASTIFWSGFDYANPSQLRTTPLQQIEANAGSPRTTELFLSFEREIITDLGLQFNLVYRKYDKQRLAHKYFPDTGTVIDSSYYVSAGLPPATIPGTGAPGDTGELKNHEWYYLNTTGTAYSASTLIKPTDYSTDYYGIDIAVNKRFSKKWMLNGSLSLQWSLPHLGKTGVIDPNNYWAMDGANYATPWTFKIGGVYALPYDVTLSFSVNARAGWRIDRTVMITDYTLPNPRSNSATLHLQTQGSEFLPAMINPSVRVEKMFRILEKGKVYAMLDLFNCLNLAIAEQRDPKLYGNYYIYPDASQNKFVKNINFYRLNKILNPFVARLGFRFNF